MRPAKAYSTAENGAVYPRDWQATIINRLIEMVDSYISRYNAKSMEISLGALSPIEPSEPQSCGISPRFTQVTGAIGHRN